MSEHDIVLEEATQEPVALEVSEVMVEAVSPKVSTEAIEGGHRVTVTDVDGSKTFDVMDGHNGEPGGPGEPGQDGVSPTISVAEITGGHRVTVTDADGGQAFDVMDGEKGKPGNPGEPGHDGVSPTITVTDITGGHRVTITDASGAHSFDVMDGESGAGSVTDVQVNGVSVLQDGVANVPKGTASTLGVVKSSSIYPIGIYSDGTLYAKTPTDAEIKFGDASGRLLALTQQHKSAFYGLAKAAGDTTQSQSSNAVGAYTESAKSAISEMLNGSVSVSGTTPTINALPGIQYVCGEVATLDITLPASGCVDVVFQSGTTPTVLTVTPPTGVTVKWANGFDPTSLDADTTYEINIKDGLGVAVEWT